MQRVLIVFLSMFSFATASAAEQGLHDDRIIVGQVSDLSGATAVWGVSTASMRDAER